LNYLDDYFWYSEQFQKIKTKVDGIQPFILRDYQRKFINFAEAIEGPKRIIVVKPRQAGFTTLVASHFSHKMATTEDFKCIGLADQFSRTSEMSTIYHTYFDLLPSQLVPMTSISNTEEILFDNPNKDMRRVAPGMNSGIKFGTANDENAGRAGTRKGAHLTEAAFYRYFLSIDEGIQNSIPLDPSTWIVKESTANGKQGIGRPFYNLWEAACRGDSIYKPFFVAWYEIDDYTLKPPSDIKLTDYEKEVLKEFPQVTIANLVWRRLKISEYLDDDQDSVGYSLPPAERFKQDFPLSAREAFRSSGSPIFEPLKIDIAVNRVKDNIVPNIKDRLSIDCYILKQFWEGLTIFTPPRQGQRYYIGADVSEGLAIGDSSSACIIDDDFNDVAYWHGKIDPDLFGHLLISLGKMYNNAIVAPEKNNMGQTTVSTIKKENYPKLYKIVSEDTVTKKIKTTYGWVTTAKSKLKLLNELIKAFREGDFVPRNHKLLLEMGHLARGDNGDVTLNGRDRVVAACIALMARKHYMLPIKISGTKKSAENYDTFQPKRKGSDIFG